MRMLLAISLLLLVLPVQAEVKLASVFSNNMVLQRDKDIEIWGQAAKGEAVAVSFAGQKVNTISSVNGQWKVQLSPLSVNRRPQTLVVQGDNRVELGNILVGDVWLASGQSNMKFKLDKVVENQEFLSISDNDNIRLLNIPQMISREENADIQAQWQVSNLDNIKQFSAIAVIFSQGLQQELAVPIGIISAAVGSTGVEAWVANETLQTEPFASAVKKWKFVEENWQKQAAVYLQKEIKKHKKMLVNFKKKGRKVPAKNLNPPTSVLHPSESRLYPGGAYNGMIMPIFPLAIKGIIWCQGEANMLRGWQYQYLLPEMISLWRNNFKQGDLPFIQVQLPELKKQVAEPQESRIAELRESQYKVSQAMVNVHNVVIIDTQQQGHIHPNNKQLPGKRMVQVVLAEVYQQAKSFSSPVFKSTMVKRNKLIVSFDDILDGLITANRQSNTSTELIVTNQQASGFTVAGKDQKYYWATAEIIGNTIVLISKDVPEPLYVRYAWADNPDQLNLYDASGGPVMPFRSDDFTAVSKKEKIYKINLIR